MSSPEHKRDTEDKSDVKNERARDEEDSESNGKRKQRSKRSVILEDIEGADSSGRRRSSTEDRNESRKRTAGSSKTVSDEVDYEVKKVSCSIFCEKEERSVNSVKSKSKIRSKAPEEVNKGNSLTHEGILGNIRRSEPEKDGFRDDRSKGRDDSWSSRDNWKRRLPNIDKSTKDRDTVYDHGREWEYQRRGRERFDRTEAVKTSSKYGISNENYDVIEIQTKPFSYGREELRSSQQSDTRPPPNDEEYAYPHNNRETKFDLHGPAQSGEDSKDRFMDDGPPRRDQNSWRDDFDFQDGKARGQISSTGSISRSAPQGIRGNRIGRGGRGQGQLTGGRDSHQVGIPLPMTGSPFGPLRMPPPGAMQPLTPIMSPGPGFPISPGVFVPGFSPIVWPGPRGVDMNLLPVPPGPTGPGFSPNIGTPPSPAMFLNQPCHGREGPPNISVAGFNSMVPLGSGQPQEKTAGGWVPPRSNGPHSKAPSRGEQDDYSQNFVDTGMRPQNYIRELELTSVVEDYPKLRELIQRKDEIVANSATAPMYYKCDLREQVLSPEFFGTKFDAILVDPPWEEYVHRAPGVTDHMEYWTFEEIMNLKIEAIADTPSFIFLWVGDGVGLEQGRQCLKKWGFRRCEDICWVKTNKTNATPGSRHDSHTLFQRSKEHCLMGIKGTVRRSTDGHIIHANIDTDVIVAEEPPYGSTAKPEDMYRIIEHFSLGRRRLELFGEDHNIRSGWLTIGKDLSSSNFNSEAYIKNFADKDGKIWQGRGGRNPPPESSHLVVTTPDIESLRPKSPMKNQYQMQQQQSNTIISVTTSNSTSNWPTGNSPHNHNAANMNQEASGSNISDSNPWSSEMEGFRGGNMGGPDNRVFDMYGYNNNVPFPQPIGDYLDYESRRGTNML